MSTTLLPAASLRQPTPRCAPQPAVVAPVPSPYGFGFFLFIVLNFVLFVRPTEIIPGLVGLEVYLVIILLCLAAAFPAVLEQLQPRTLERTPLTVCVIAFTLAVVLSHVAAFRLELAAEWGFDSVKVLLYYLLFVGLVRDVSRLRSFLWWMTVFICICTALTVLQFHEVIELPVLTKLKDGEFTRLRASGIFHDPNDLCVLLVVGLVLAAYWLTERRSGALRLLWFGPMALLFYALLLTQSRGGLVALMAGVAALFWARHGVLAALGLAALALPVLLVLVGGRQASLSTGEGTGQQRIMIWSDALVEFRRAPLFGVGRDEFKDIEGQVAHNSYLHALVELGLCGGVFFGGGFLHALAAMNALKSGKRTIVDPELQRLYPFALAALAGYMAGMMSVTLTYLIPTYTMLGIAVVFLRLAKTEPPHAEPRFDHRFLGQLFGLTLLFIVGLSIFVRLTRA